MKRLKLFSTPKPTCVGNKNVTFDDGGDLEIEIKTERKPKLNFSIISDEDEFLSCDEMRQRLLF